MNAKSLEWGEGKRMNRRSFLQSIAACVAAVGAYRDGKAAPIALEPKAPPAPPKADWLAKCMAYRFVRYHGTVPITSGLYSSSRCITGASGSNDGKTWHEIWSTTTEGGK